QLLHQALAARGARPDPRARIAVLRHEALLHAAAVAHPDDPPAGVAHLVGDREPRKDVPARAAGHDDDGLHAGIPRASWRFSQSIRRSSASATKLTTRPEPP